jgi:hypothetical protein
LFLEDPTGNDWNRGKQYAPAWCEEGVWCQGIPYRLIMGKSEPTVKSGPNKIHGRVFLWSYCISQQIRRLRHALVMCKVCKIWGFHGSDYEESHLLGYKNPVCTSQETHYVSATESSRLMLCKIWGFHGGDYEECSLLGYKNSLRTSQETHYVSATEPSPLMLCKICGFHGGDYEECRLLGYKNSLSTSQETHYVSATEPSPLMLCKICGFHGGDYEEWRLLGYYTVWLL